MPKRKIKETKPISWRKYATNPFLPKLMDTSDIIRYIVNKEDYAMHSHDVIWIPQATITNEKIVFHKKITEIFTRSYRFLKGLLP